MLLDDNFYHRIDLIDLRGCKRGFRPLKSTLSSSCFFTQVRVSSHKALYSVLISLSSTRFH